MLMNCSELDYLLFLLQILPSKQFNALEYTTWMLTIETEEQGPKQSHNDLNCTTGQLYTYFLYLFQSIFLYLSNENPNQQKKKENLYKGREKKLNNQEMKTLFSKKCTYVDEATIFHVKSRSAVVDSVIFQLFFLAIYFAVSNSIADLF